MQENTSPAYRSQYLVPKSDRHHKKENYTDLYPMKTDTNTQLNWIHVNIPKNHYNIVKQLASN